MICLFSKNTITISRGFLCFGFYKPLETRSTDGEIFVPNGALTVIKA